MAWGDDDKAASFGVEDLVAGKKKTNGLADFGKGVVTGVGEAVSGLGHQFAKVELPYWDTGQKLGRLVTTKITGKDPGPGFRNPLDLLPDAIDKNNTYRPMTMAGRAGETLGQMAPAAAAPGSLAARAANVIVPTVTAEIAGKGARAMGAGPKGETAARVVGGLVGGGVASVRMTPRTVTGPAATVGTRATQNPGRMSQRAQEFREAGIEPTFVDVIDDAGRGQVRAAANRPTPGRDVANDFATGRAENLPDRIGAQARTHLSADPRTPDAIRASMSARRSANADTAFGAVRGDQVDLGQDALMTLRVPEVVDAIGEAMRRERDPTVRSALEDLKTWAAGDHASGMAPPITVGMADRISRVLLSKARASSDNDLRATLTQFGEAIRSPAREASPGYADALQGYGADTRLQQAAGVGERLMSGNTDEFVRDASRLTDDERALALAAGRRAIERKVGENPSAAPGVARRLSVAPEQRARTAALMGGPDQAAPFESAVRLEERAVDNGRMVQPRAGSTTHLNESDGERLAGMVETGKKMFRQDWVGLGLDWLRSRGLSDTEAEAIVRMATDPAQTDHAIAQVAQRLGRREADRFRLLASTATAAALTSAPAAASEPQH